MIGKELYQEYTERQLSINDCSCDNWDDLQESEQAVWDNMAYGLEIKPQGVVLDLNEIALKAIRDAYIEAFKVRETPELDANLTCNDIDWHIREIIAAAAKKQSVVIVKDNGQIFAGFQKICDSDVATFVDLDAKHQARIMVFDGGKELDETLARLGRFAYKVTVKNFVEM